MNNHPLSQSQQRLSLLGDLNDKDSSSLLDDVDVLSNTLCKTPYGEEDENVLARLTRAALETAAPVEELSWHVLFRLWLKARPSANDDAPSNVLFLPLIRSKLQASLLHAKESSEAESSLLVLPTADDDTHNNAYYEHEHSSWKHDVMLQDWTMVRFLVEKDLEVKKHTISPSSSLKRRGKQDEADVQCIMAGIDALVMRGHHHDVCDVDTLITTPARVLQEYFLQRSLAHHHHGVVVDDVDDDAATQFMDAKSPSSKDDIVQQWSSTWQVLPLHDDDASSSFSGSSSITARRVLVLRNNRDRLLQAVEQGPQWRVQCLVSELPFRFLQWACRRRRCCRDLVTNTVKGRSCSGSNCFRRGRALLYAYLLLRHGNVALKQVSATPFPDLSSSLPNIKSTVEAYLHCEQQSGHAESIPNVHELALALWDIRLNHQTNILESFRVFASWLPISPLVERYRSLWKQDDGGKECASPMILRAATDVLCELIGNEVEEWKLVWDNAFIQSTWLPLAHAVVLDFRANEEIYGTIVAVMRRLLNVVLPQAMATACPQLEWIIFLFSNIPIGTKEGNNVPMQSSHVEDMRQLYKRFNSGCEDLNLPPPSLYIESVVSACAIPAPEESKRLWTQHIVDILSRFKEKEGVAVEWFRCLSNGEPLNPSAETLHRRVCRYLWEPRVQESSISIPQLLTESKQIRVLSCTPPECLFVGAGNLASQAEQMLAAFGDEHSCLAVLTVGLALAIQHDASSTIECRDVLYRYLRSIVVKADTQLVESVELALSTHKVSLKWWSTLHGDLVRNERPVFMATEDTTSFDLSRIDAFLVSRKRPREVDKEEAMGVETIAELSTKGRGEPRSRASVATVIRSLYSDIKYPKQVSDSINSLEDTLAESDAATIKDESDDYHDEDDDQILLL